MNQYNNKIASKYKDEIIGFSGLVSMLMVWHLYSYHINNFTVPGPIDCLHTSLLLAFNLDFLNHVIISLARLLSGMIIGCSLGILLSIIMSISKPTFSFFNPIIKLLSPMPPIAWSPLLVIIFGIEDGSKVALIAIGSFCLTHANSLNELINMPSKYIEISKHRSKSTLSLVFNVYLPYLLPSLLITVEIVFSISWILLIAAETMVSDHGIGWYIWDRRMYGFYKEMFAAIIWLGILASLMGFMTKQLRNKLCRWCVKQ